MSPKKKSEAKKEEQQATAAEVKQVTAATQTKQEATLQKLRDAFAVKGLELTTRQDGKYIVLVVEEQGWPLILCGPSGGITLPELKSYSSAYDAALRGKELLARQTEREQKRIQASKPPATVASGKKQKAVQAQA